MGNLINTPTSKKQRTFDSIVSEELQKPLMPDVQHYIHNRLNQQEKSIEHLQDNIRDIKTQLQDILDSLKVINTNITQHKIRVNKDVYKLIESTGTICEDLDKLVKNDRILKREIDQIRTKIHDLEKGRHDRSRTNSFSSCNEYKTRMDGFPELPNLDTHRINETNEADGVDEN